MSQWEKLLSRLEKLDAGLRFAELEKILLTYGYIPEETSGGSSHVTFRKKDRYPVTIPRHVPIGRTYINLVRDVLEEDIKNERS